MLDLQPCAAQLRAQAQPVSDGLCGTQCNHA